ncbi:MAG: hypothetical protein Q9225_003979 [Loekoesia sp. 1 TL-2023]
MSFQTQFSLSLELAKVFPVGEVLKTGVERLVSLVRALKADGSDYLVEEDLATIFGRGKIERSLEEDFRKAVRTRSIQPFHADSPISLDTGPGATVRRALKERFYMSSVIQLSFLVWMHEETTLAAALVESMLIRYESNVYGATPDPDYDGILKTLQACSSQTSQYRWDNLVSLITRQFPNSTPWFCAVPSPLRSLSFSLLLGAMDYLYMVQTLPEDRFIMVESQAGLIPIVIWAHYILGLTVVVKHSPDGDVAFGRMENPQVIIKWFSPSSAEGFLAQGTVTSTDQEQGKTPTIYLMDADMHVLLKTEPTDKQGTRIEGEECQRLKGYGTMYLQRILNTYTFVANNDPMLADTANFAVSFAILVSKAMYRVPFSGLSRDPNEERDALNPVYLATEYWRFFDSSSLLFWGIKLDKRKVSEYLDKLIGKNIADMALPTSTRNHLQKFQANNERDELEEWRQDFLGSYIMPLASWILSFAHVIDIESCADLPLRIASGWRALPQLLQWNGLDSIEIESDIWFNQISGMMRKYATDGQLSTESKGIFLTCHQGWSLFYSSVGDYDPEEITCELLCIKQGVPTNTRTGERKYRISDAPPVEQDPKNPKAFEEGTSYLPRCLTKVYKRTEHYSSRSQEFWLSIRFDIEELGFRKDELDQRYSLYASYFRFHQALWGVVKTLPCPHRNENHKALPLDLDTKTVAGLTWAYSKGEAEEPRICICLVKGDARARWLVVYSIFANRHGGAQDRQLLLRCSGCCLDCSVKAAGTMRGQWLVIL